MKIGILALQGAFIEHENILHDLGIKTQQIRQLKDLQTPIDGLILPGGESTAINRLLEDLGLYNEIKSQIQSGLPVFGTCAGLILLANKISNQDNAYLKTMNITAKRNAYGRQLASFKTLSQFKDLGEIPMVFIRAPYIEECSNTVEVLATHDQKIVAAREKNQLVTAFHPELTDNTLVHQYFIDMIKHPK